MYILASALLRLPIISLQTGEPIGMTRELILDPSDLRVVAMLCNATGKGEESVLMMGDARQVAQDCLIVNSENELTEPADVVRLQPLLHERFKPIGRHVITDLGRKLGTVDDYTINLDTMHLQKLYVKQSLLQSFMGSSLIIDRAQIIDVTGQRIVVRDADIKAPALPIEPVPDS